MPNKNATLFYFHDPMCSWCWGYKPTFKKLIAALPETVSLNYICGGLAPDSDEPMPEAMRTAIEGYWHNIENKLGTEFNYEFWRKCEPRRSTYPACRAVLAAKLQDKESQMIAAIQTAYYLQARNPSDISTHIELAVELDVDVDQFTEDLQSDALEQTFQDQLLFTRRMGVQGFPSLVLQVEDSHYGLAIDYLNFTPTLESIQQALQQHD